MSEVKTETETAALFDVDNFDPEFKGCDAVWPYDQEQAYAGAKKWALTLSVALEAARQELAEADTHTVLRIVELVQRERADKAESELAELRKERDDAQDNFRLITETLKLANDNSMQLMDDNNGLRETVGALSETLEVGHTFERMYQYSLGATWTVEHQQLLDAAQTAFIEAFADSLARLRASQENTRG